MIFLNKKILKIIYILFINDILLLYVGLGVDSLDDFVSCDFRNISLPISLAFDSSKNEEVNDWLIISLPSDPMSVEDAFGLKELLTSNEEFGVTKNGIHNLQQLSNKPFSSEVTAIGLLLVNVFVDI